MATGFYPVEHPRRYFKKGRVFIVSWVGPTSDGRHEKNRRFIVIRPKATHCVCLPITTYKGQATSKAGLNPDDHAALVKKGEEVQLHVQESKLKRSPVFIILEDNTLPIDPMSRINFGKVYTIEHNLSVRTVGRIHPSSLEALEMYFRESMKIPESDPNSVAEPTPPSSPSIRNLPTLTTDEYYYCPLEKHEIRLLLIHPGNAGRHDDAIKATMLTKGLNDTSVVNNYYALSYVWGSDEPSHRVEIVEQGSNPAQNSSRKVIHIKDNLYDALCALRRSKEDLLLWVDAICIDQNSLEEKNCQVSQMARIFQSAKNVCVWLGRGNASSVRAMEYVKGLASNPSKDIFDTSEDDSKAFQTLAMAKWFNRRWALQEIGLAKSATVHCGNKVVRWEDFADVVSILMRKLVSTPSMIEDSSARGDMAIGAGKLVMTLNSILRTSEDGTIQKCYLGMEDLVVLVSRFEASDPRDYIFSLLSLAQDVPQSLPRLKQGHSSAPAAPFNIVVDYGIDEMELLVEFTKSCVRNSKSLDIICRPWAPDIETPNDDGPKAGVPFPSWIKRLSGSAIRKPMLILQGRQLELNLFSSLCGGVKRTYNAANATEARCFFNGESPLKKDIPATKAGNLNGSVSTNSSSGKDIATSNSWTTLIPRSSTCLPATSDPNPHTLTVQGVRLTAIKACSKYYTGVIDAQWLRCGGWQQSAPNIIPEKLWRTLVADRGPDGRPPLPWYRRACLMCLNDAELMTTTSDLDITKKPSSDLMIEYLNRVKSVISDRKFFLGRDVLGLAPENVRIGDLVCVLTGCTVPVVLRPQRRPHQPECFEVIGEAYAYGYMDGEAMREEKLQSFVLV
ncbi:MAG: hypothetical protein Q9227_004746 [Pyrenula ochraceoflavens]